MSLTSIRVFSSDKNADISADADCPIVPLNATIVAFSPKISLFFTITSHFAKERGEQNDKVFMLGLKMYGLSSWLPSLYDARTLGNNATKARTTREISLADAHCNQSFVFGLLISTLHTRLPAWANIESPTPSDALLLVAKIMLPLGSGTSPTILSNINLVKITCNNLGDFMNSSSKITLGLGSSRQNRLET